jgi:hypothetical protein
MRLKVWASHVSTGPLTIRVGFVDRLTAPSMANLPASEKSPPPRSAWSRSCCFCVHGMGWHRPCSLSPGPRFTHLGRRGPFPAVGREGAAYGPPRGQSRGWPVHQRQDLRLPGGAASISRLRGPADIGRAAARVDMSDLKAVFFVRDLAGPHTDRGEFPENRPMGPRSPFRVAVTFRDGEVLIGTTADPPSASHGLLVVPADPQSNNLRVYVVPTAVRSVRIVEDVRPVRQGSLGRRQAALVPEPKGQLLPAAWHTWLASPVPA